MKLDEIAVLLTCLAACLLSSFERGLVFQTAVFLFVMFTAFRFDPSRRGSNSNNKTTNTAASVFNPTGAVRMLVPLLLAAERLYHLRHSLGFSSGPFWASLLWTWTSMAVEKQPTTVATTATSISPMFVDRERLGNTVMLTVTTCAAFLLLTLNINIAGCFPAFVFAAFITEHLLRALFAEQRKITAKGKQAGGEAAIEEQQQLRVLDSEIFLVASLAGWLACECVSNPFAVAPPPGSLPSPQTRTVASATPEVVVGRSILFAAWLGMVVFGIQRLRHRVKRNSSNGNNNGEITDTKPATLSWWLFGVVGFVACVSLFMTGWQCAYCFRDDAVFDPTRGDGGDPAMQGNITLPQRMGLIRNEITSALRRSLDFQNPLRVWLNLLMPSSQQNHRRLGWIALWATLLPPISAFPFLLNKLSPKLHRAVPRIVWRKWFHFVAVAAFTVASFCDAPFMALAWLGAMAVAALVEQARFLGVSPFDKLTPLLESVTDDRDALIIRTHWYLMLGCALPVILTQRRIYFWANEGHWLPSAALRLLPGLGCLGIGDALSAIVGTVFGRDGRAKWAVLFNPEGHYTALPQYAEAASPLVRKNPVLAKKSLVGTLLGGCVLTVLSCALCIVGARYVTDRVLIGHPFQWASFIVQQSFGQTMRLVLRMVGVIVYGAVYETVSHGVDNLEVPLAAMAVAFLVF